MKKSIVCLIAASLLVGSALAAMSFRKDSSYNLFHANVEALAGQESSSNNWSHIKTRCPKCNDGTEIDSCLFSDDQLQCTPGECETCHTGGVYAY